MLIQSTRSRNPIRAGALRFPPGSISKMKFFFWFCFLKLSLSIWIFSGAKRQTKKKRDFLELRYLFFSFFPPLIDDCGQIWRLFILSRQRDANELVRAMETHGTLDPISVSSPKGKWRLCVSSITAEEFRPYGGTWKTYDARIDALGPIQTPTTIAYWNCLSLSFSLWWMIGY